jgi:hypothetical protein
MKQRTELDILEDMIRNSALSRDACLAQSRNEEWRYWQGFNHGLIEFHKTLRRFKREEPTV